MTLPTTEHLAALTHAELVGSATEVCVEGQRWEAENQQLKAESPKEPPPPPTSLNSSQPPARDVKHNLPADRKRKKLGPLFGHERNVRPLVDQQDPMIAVRWAWCA